MSSVKAVVVAADIMTAYGNGLDSCWEGLLANRTAVARLARFETGAFHSDYGATIPGLDYHCNTSLAMQMLVQLFDRSKEVFPADARLLLATTKGEIDLLEKSIITGAGDAAESSLDHLLGKVANITGARGGGMVLSAACTSSTAAAARAAAMIRNGTADCVLVVACDSVTEFIYSGFSSLMALDKVPARPFDKHRAGLSVGEAAAFALIMSEERARREERTILGEVAGWGMSDDANHMTGPSRASEGLILAIDKALRSAEAEPQQLGFISAHGTGTVYNDAMEMLAFRSVVGDRKLPVYSIKGGIGHTMGAAGLVEMIVALRALRVNNVPPTVNMVEVDDDAQGWVANRSQDVDRNALALLTSAGFSGVNAALVLA